MMDSNESRKQDGDSSELSFLIVSRRAMTADQRSKRIERTLKRNESAVERANRRTDRLQETARQSSGAADRALRHLRENAAG